MLLTVFDKSLDYDYGGSRSVPFVREENYFWDKILRFARGNDSQHKICFEDFAGSTVLPDEMLKFIKISALLANEIYKFIIFQLWHEIFDTLINFLNFNLSHLCPQIPDS